MMGGRRTMMMHSCGGLSEHEMATSMLYALAELSTDFIYAKDTSLRMVFCNSALARALGKEPRDLLCKTDTENGLEQEFVKGSVERGIRGWEADDRSALRGQVISSRRESARIGGEVRYFDTLKMPLRASSGAVIGLLGSSRDVTDVVVTDQKSREQAAIVEASDDAIVSKTLEGLIRSWNLGAESLYGYSAREVVGRSINLLIPPEAHDELPSLLERIRRGEKVDHYETIRVRKDGRRIDVSVTISPVLGDGGVIVGASAIARDITESKRAVRRIESLAEFPDESPHPVLRVTKEGVVIYANAASRASVPLQEGRPLGDTAAVLLPAIAAAWASGSRQEIEADLGTATFIFTIVPIMRAGYVNLYGRNITEERRLSERLRQVEKMEAIGQLTGGIAHDFNNVLQAVMGYSEVLQGRLTGKEHGFTVEISRAAKRAAALTAQLLAFSRKQVLKPRIVNPEELIRGLQKMLGRVLGEDIEIQSLFFPGTGNFLADQGQIEQVLVNLAVNARDAMPTGGKLLIEARSVEFDADYAREHPGSRPGRYVCISVSDTGIGMDKETLTRIYEPFFTTKPVGEGTGLGLSTVLGIVQQSGGHLNCYSEPGKGTTFAVFLPEARESATPPVTDRPTAEVPGGNETILLVDDDAPVRGIERLVLSRAGYAVIESQGGEEALSAAAALGAPAALLITDVVMPRISGKQLADRLRETYPAMRVLYASGYTSSIMSHHGILDTDVDYLQKPFLAQDLLSKVRTILDRSS
jgi:two-component system, cell cycle sensor histidine kinase and response regulator CckA